MRQILAQLSYHFKIEYRSWPQIAALVLFMWCVAYIIYRIKPEMTTSEFNFIYWVILMLTAVSVSIRSTAHTNKNERLLIYTIVSPSTALLGLIFFNALYMLIVGLAFYGMMIVLFYPDISWSLSYAVLLITGTVSIGVILSFVSAVSRYIEGQHTALSILSIPLLIPTIMLAHSLGEQMLEDTQPVANDYVIIGALSMISAGLALILFPYLWRE